MQSGQMPTILDAAIRRTIEAAANAQVVADVVRARGEFTLHEAALWVLRQSPLDEVKILRHLINEQELARIRPDSDIGSIRFDIAKVVADLATSTLKWPPGPAVRA